MSQQQDWVTMDRGEPLSGEEIVKRVSARVEVLRAVGQPRPGDDFRIVLHPFVFEDVYITVAPSIGGPVRPPWWYGAFQWVPSERGSLAPSAVRCCGILMDTDPSLRYDEVVLRLDERL